MKRTVKRSGLPQKARRRRSVFPLSLYNAFCALRGANVFIRNNTFGLVLSLILVGQLVNPISIGAIAPTQTTATEVIIHLLDTNNQPLVGMMVNLVLNNYGASIEEVPLGSCVTDASGSCSITVNDPPRLRSGQIESFIDLGTYGRQLIGWKGECFEITLLLYPNGKLATPPMPLDQPYEGQTDQPTDVPLSTSTSAPAATVTTVPTATAFLATPAKTLPTETVTVALTAMITPQSVPTQPFTPILEPAPHKAKRSGWVWIGLGLALFAVLGITLIIHYLRQQNL